MLSNLVQGTSNIPCYHVHSWYHLLVTVQRLPICRFYGMAENFITSPLNGPVLFWWLASVVVCNAVGVRAGRLLGALKRGVGTMPAVGSVGRPTLHDRPVRLHLVRATPCLFPSFYFAGCIHCIDIVDWMASSIYKTCFSYVQRLCVGLTLSDFWKEWWWN